MIPPEAVNVEDITDTALPESTVSSARTTGTERICKPKEQRAQVEKRGRGHEDLQRLISVDALNSGTISQLVFDSADIQRLMAGEPQKRERLLRLRSALEVARSELDHCYLSKFLSSPNLYLAKIIPIISTVNPI